MRGFFVFYFHIFFGLYAVGTRRHALAEVRCERTQFEEKTQQVIERNTLSLQQEISALKAAAVARTTDEEMFRHEFVDAMDGYLMLVERVRQRNARKRRAQSLEGGGAGRGLLHSVFP